MSCYIIPCHPSICCSNTSNHPQPLIPQHWTIFAINITVHRHLDITEYTLVDFLYIFQWGEPNTFYSGSSMDCGPLTKTTRRYIVDYLSGLPVYMAPPGGERCLYVMMYNTSLTILPINCTFVLAIRVYEKGKKGETCHINKLSKENYMLLLLLC